MSTPEFPRASKKNNSDVYNGSVQVYPRTFKVHRGSGGYVNVISPAGNIIDYADRFYVSSSNAGFIPQQGGVTAQYGTGEKTYGYRRIPFVHKLGGPQSEATLGNKNVSCEILRLNLPTEDQPNILNPYNGATFTYITFPFGASRPVSESEQGSTPDIGWNSGPLAEGDTSPHQQGNSQYVRAMGNLRPTKLFKQKLVFAHKQPNIYDANWTIWKQTTALGDPGNLSATYETISVDNTKAPWTGVSVFEPYCIYSNNTSIVNSLADHPSINDGIENLGAFGHGVEGFGGPVWIHPLLWDPQYFIVTPINPILGYSDNNGPINIGADTLLGPDVVGTTSTFSNVYPYNPILGINNSYPSSQFYPYKNGAQSNTESQVGDIHFRSNPNMRQGTIIKGIIELY